MGQQPLLDPAAGVGIAGVPQQVGAPGAGPTGSLGHGYDTRQSVSEPNLVQTTQQQQQQPQQHTHIQSSQRKEAYDNAVKQIIAEENEERSKIHRYPGLERFDLIEKMGDGAFSIVYKAYDRTNKTYVAVKIIHKQELSTNQVCFLTRASLLTKHWPPVAARDCLNQRTGPVARACAASSPGIPSSVADTVLERPPFGPRCQKSRHFYSGEAWAGGGVPPAAGAPPQTLVAPLASLESGVGWPANGGWDTWPSPAKTTRAKREEQPGSGAEPQPPEADPPLRVSQN
ncbi:hypothetical protein AWJ20_2154 [Sugiyamaella lignohabitans]|uniref:Protein kinase domain-containing protein n=1 Tax=Sugiyamaella lignohabitans TaxID=796027 RepID=A0A167EX01_9ASCO|nr:uncharacterized protein AWJ20_2154 [Sugiyamaella lignohabitans]ANB14556.1 hypothetical protein AWJ20_2154 [Sugiyamaella lignohabitans]